MGETIRSTVKKAARLAVYEEIMMRVKNHHTPPTIRPERDLSSEAEWEKVQREGDENETGYVEGCGM